MMDKRTIFAAPFLAAVAFVCQPMMAQDTAADRAANQADRAINNAGNEVNRAADRTGAAASDAATGAADATAAQLAGARQGNMDQRFAMKTADMNNFEIQAGKLAQQKAQRQEVKELAQMTVQDHTKAQQQLQQIGQKKGMTFSDQLMPVHQAMLTELSQMEGQEFERAYVYGQVAGHTKAMLKLRDAQSDLQDPELKQYATMIMPKIRQHLQHAQQVAKADEAITAGARIGGDRSGHATDGHGDAGQSKSGAGATDRLRPDGASDAADNTGGGNPARGASPTRGADAPGQGPSSPGNESNR
jgi:putative membrane protein